MDVRWDLDASSRVNNRFALLILVGIAVAILTEVAAYLWHRFGAHTSWVPGIHSTHQEHHEGDLTHEAHGDFGWIIIVLLMAGIVSYGTWIMGLFSGDVLIVALLTSILVFTWNWYIHAAYHKPNHW